MKQKFIEDRLAYAGISQESLHEEGEFETNVWGIWTSKEDGVEFKMRETT